MYFIIGCLNRVLQTAASVLFLPFFSSSIKNVIKKQMSNTKLVSRFILKSGWISGFTPSLLSLEAGAD